MAEDELTLAPQEGNDASATADDGAKRRNGLRARLDRSGDHFDEQTLGRSSSVFDSGVDLMAPMQAPPAPAGDPASADGMTIVPMSQRERRRRVRLEARRVRRIIRYIDPWSVFKISIIFYTCLWLIMLLAGVLLWSFAESSGTLESIEDQIESLFTLEEENEFFSGSTIFRSYAIGTLFLAIAGVPFNVLLAVLYNLMSELVGGVRLTVIEEESARFQPPRRRRR